jgi:putative colanic acid biosynthesis acetyltransferase WcaF
MLMQMNQKVSLSTYSTKSYNPGAGKIYIALWFLVSVIIVRNPMVLFSSLKVLTLRLFGAKIGRGVVIKQGVNIKYPWRLRIGDHVWLGENVWIDNLVEVEIGDNTCISQGAMLLTGNHNYKLETFDLITESIIIEEGVWIGAKSIVCPGVHCKKYAVLTVGSVAIDDLEESVIYQGNPAIAKRNRWSDAS